MPQTGLDFFADGFLDLDADTRSVLPISILFPSTLLIIHSCGHVEQSNRCQWLWQEKLYA